MRVAFIGLGEVFTNKDLFQFFIHLNRQNISLFFYTNGMLLLDKNIDALIRNDVKEFGVSFESAIPENFEKIRKGAKFSTIVNNIKKVRERYEEANKQIEISFGSVLLEKSIQEPENLFSIIDIANDLSVSLVNFANVANIKESGLDKYYSDATENAKLDKLFARLQEYADIKNTRIRLPKTSLSQGECRLPWVAAFVSVEGEVLPCCALMELGDHDEMVSLYSLGNLIHQPLSEIWNSKKAIDFRRRLSSSEPYECCRKCSYYTGVL
jgi:radical SAM protein with 4Fe4S-binding SPASM domain